MEEQGIKTPITWHDIPKSPSSSTCKVWLMQAGGLTLPEDMVYLPEPNKENRSLHEDREEWLKRNFYVPDFVFLIEHTPSKELYVFDLGMRKDLENSPPTVRSSLSTAFHCYPESPADILKEHAPKEHQPSNVKATVLSHVHFDHVGDAGKAGFTNAELWLGPSACTKARPGYPVDPESSNLTDDFPKDGSKKIVEFTIPPDVLAQRGDDRAETIQKSTDAGHYESVESRVPKRGWFGLGSFDLVSDLFGDGSVYLVDAPGHCPGHQMYLIRVKVNSQEPDDFVLLAGDCFHHPALLKEPLLTARPPYSKSGMHADPDQAIDTIQRTKRLAERDNIWVVGAHDFSIQKAISNEDVVKGLVLVNDWREKGWKGVQV